MQIALEDPALVVGVPEDRIDLAAEGEPASQDFLDDLRDELKEFGLNSDQLPYEETEIGRGASSLALLLVLSAVFLSGKKINENLDAWLAIAKKVKSLVARIKKKQRAPVYISDSVAAALAAAEIMSRDSAVGIPRLLAHQRFPIRGGFLHREHEDQFKSNPERFYLFTFEIETVRVFVVGMKSTGEILFLEEWDTDDHLAFYGFYPDRT